jgi:DNA-binding NarL/FixJ family response regulator
LQSVLACLRAVAGGGLWADGDLRVTMPRPGYARPSRLTPRESQIFNLMERGLRHSEIGQMLGIRPGTVKVHLRHISEKTGAQSRYHE